MSMLSELESYQQLYQTPEFWKQLEECQGNELSRQNQLRKQFPVEVVRAGLLIAQLRELAAQKFTHADQMWMTRQTLEQATQETIAQHKAKRFANLADQRVYDLCSGLGGDALAIARSQQVECYDINPLVSQCLQWNSQVYGVESQLGTHLLDITTESWNEKVVQIDPDRRDANGNRSRRLEGYTPNLEWLQELVLTARCGALKLGPASNFGGKFQQVEVELISLGGECKEATVWFGELANTETPWRATSLPSGETIAGDPLFSRAPIGPVQRYVYDPDPALVRSGLIDQLACEQGATRLDEADEYLTSDEIRNSAFLTCFEVLEVLPNNEKQLRQYFRKNPVHEIEIKCRHVKVNPDLVRKKLPRTGEGSRVVIFARVEGKSQILIARRMT